MPNTSKKAKHSLETRLNLGKKPSYLAKLNKKEHVKSHKHQLLKQPLLTENSRSMYNKDSTTIYFKATNDKEFYEALKKQTPKKPKRRSTSCQTPKTEPDNTTSSTSGEAEVGQTPSNDP
jgi:hypothetical protein